MYYVIYMKDNLLLDKYPEIAEEWNYEKNKDIDINKIAAGSHLAVWWICDKGHEFQTTVLKRIYENRSCGKCKINNKKYDTSFGVAYPEILKEWDYENNENIDPFAINKNSRIIVAWKCQNNHKYKLGVCTRIEKEDCPYCILKNEHKLLENNQQLMNEWHPTKNDDLNPNIILLNSNIIVWWLCNENHEWQTSVYARKKGVNCSECKKKYKNFHSIPTKNSKNNQKLLLNKYPKIAEEWNYEKNQDMDIDKITYTSKLEVWWICVKGHEWQDVIYKRIHDNKKCGQCKLQEKLNTNSLFAKCPKLVNEWDYEKNELKPTEVFHQSNKKVWWKCEKNHSWKAPVSIRTRENGSQCPYCSGRNATNENNFGLKYPQHIKYWNYDKNDFLPFDVTPKSHRKVWLKCEKNHEWQQMVFDLIVNKKCQQCYLEENNLEKLYPDIAEEWCYEKNGDLKPNEVTYGIGKKVWWKCSKNAKHIWNAKISGRTASNNGCPYCNTNGYSKTAIMWLDNISKTENIKIQHANNGGEVSLKINNMTFKVDGFCHRTNTVYEHLGCWWHADPRPDCNLNKHKKFSDIHPSNKKLNGDLYIKTIERLCTLKKAGYNVIYIWECDFMKNKPYMRF